MKLKITVHGVAYEVEVEVLDAGEGFAPASALPPAPRQGQSAPPARPAGQTAPPPRQAAASAPQGAGSARSVASPIAGTVVEVKAKVGAEVSQGEVLLVIEAMKMNTSIAAPAAGRVKTIAVGVGDAVREGQILVEFEE